MINKAIIVGMLGLTAICATPAAAVSIMDPTDDFIPSYTAGPRFADLDVTGFSVNYDSMSQFFTLGATFAGNSDPQTAGLYIFGVNTGTGIARPFASIGQPDVIFNQAIVIQKNGTGSVGPNALDPTGISIAGNMLTARVPLALLPSTGFGPTQYGFNLWPRNGVGNVNQITDFAPENATVSIGAVPEPATWLMMLVGFGGVGFSLRRRIGKVVTGTAYA